MKKKVLFCLLVLILFAGCKQGFHEKLTDYELAVSEIHANSAHIDSLFTKPNPNFSTLVLDTISFENNPRLKKRLSNCYKLLKEHKAAEIQYESDNCIYINLKYDNGWFRTTIECLKIGSPGNSKPDWDVEKDELIKPGWRYQLLSMYTAD